MKFSYRCANGHVFEREFRAGEAAELVLCGSDGRCFRWICEDENGNPTVHAKRDYESDFASQSVNTGDPFRAYHLSSAKTRAATEQGRPIGGPTDNFERKREEAVRGIKFVGNDTSGMTANARRGIEIAKERKK